MNGTIPADAFTCVPRAGQDYNPRPVRTAILVTEDNVHEVAAWTGWGIQTVQPLPKPTAWETYKKPATCLLGAGGWWARPGWYVVRWHVIASDHNGFGSCSPDLFASTYVTT